MKKNKIKKVIILGAGGNALVMESTIEDINKEKKILKLIGFLDDTTKNKSKKLLGPINEKNIKKYSNNKDIFFLWSLRSTNLKQEAYKKFLKLSIPKKKFINIIHPTATISKTAKLGSGITIHPYVNIGPNTKIGNHVNIFSQSTIGHDTKLDDFAYVANNSSIGAYVEINQGGYIGMNATIKERVKIKKWSVVGMGSVVIKNVNAFKTVVGNPAKELKKK